MLLAQDAATQPDSQSPPPETTGLAEQQAQDLAFLRQVLMNPAGEPEALAGATERLLAMPLPQAREVLAEALRDGPEPILLAVLDALRATPEPPVDLLEPCLSRLGETSPAVRNALALALVRYQDDALTRLAAIAADPQAEMDERLGAIHALGMFRSHGAAARLMELLEAEPGEPGEIACAVCASLERLSGSPFGCNPQRWRQWWQHMRHLSPEAWNEAIARMLGDRIAELQEQIARQTEEYEAIKRRLSAVYGELFPALSLEEQLKRLPMRLADELAPVRAFAVARVERLMRDSVRIPRDIQDQLAERLRRDPSPALRRQAARLLDELSYEELAALLTERLREESDPEVSAALLGLLTRRPHADAIDGALRWLAHPDLGPAAAETIWAVPTLRDLPAEWLDAIRQGLHAIDESRRTPAHERLLALLGDDDDLARAESLLDEQDPQLQAGVAEALARRGQRQPLLDRADDPEIYPHALRVLADGPADLPSFRILSHLRPQNSHAERWAEAVRTLAGRLSVVDRLEADALLSDLPYASGALRVALLMPLAEMPPDAITPEQRAATLTRLAPLLIDAGQAGRAHELLAQFNGVEDSPALLRARFRAAALSGRHDLADQFCDDPVAWVRLLDWAADYDRPAAERLRAEIARRFDERLDEATRALYDAACAKLAAATDEPADTPPPPASDPEDTEES